jgi:hypothetical protein
MKPVVALASSARIPDGILYHELHDELILLNLDTGVYFGLNAVGASIWRLIQTHRNRSLQQILMFLLEEYDVEKERCARDLLALVSRLEENQLLEIAC